LTASRSKKEAEFMRNFINSYDFKILDFGFGWARHLKAFAEMGYKDLTGIDFSEKLFEKAKENLKNYPFVKLFKSSFVEFKSNKKYDFIFQVFTTFGYDTRLYDENNLKNVAKLLSKEGIYLLDQINPTRLLKNNPLKIIPVSGVYSTIDEKRKISKMFFNINGIKDMGEMNIYTLTEFKRMFKKAKLKIIKTFGDFNGNKYSDKSERLILAARKA
jgi:SAM-dependent methyltransferase